MVTVGTKVRVMIPGGTSLFGAGSTSAIQVGPQGSMQVTGTIIEDLGDRWGIHLDMSLNGSDRLELSKAAFKGQQNERDHAKRT